jgi:hypothetical protein
MATSGTVCGILAVLLTLFDSGAAVAADRPGRATASFIVRQQFEAEVREVDATAGVLVLKTKAGRLRLQAANAAITPFRKGDSVVLDVSLIRHADPAGLPRRAEEPSPAITQRLPASISSIQRSIEVVALNTTAGGLTLSVPSPAIARLHTGDSLWLELAVRADANPSALASPDTPRRNGGFTGLLFMLFGGGNK